MQNKLMFFLVAIVCTLSLGVFWSQNPDEESPSPQFDQTTTDISAQVPHKEENHELSPSFEEKDDGHGHAESHGEEEVVHLTEAELKEFDISVSRAQSGAMEQFVELPGEIVLNADRIAHVVPRVSGIARDVLVSEGEKIFKGDLMAVIESRELADSKATLLAATERETMAQVNFKREERLWEKKVTSEQEFLDARKALAEAKIERNSAEQKLHAIGYTETEITEWVKHPTPTYTRFEIRAPQTGTIIEKHMTLGENVNVETNVFTIADLSTVWVNINVYQKDLAHVQKGQTVSIDCGHGVTNVSGTISWVGPQIDEVTRTAKARVVLNNPDGNLRPGLFVTARVAVDRSSVGIIVPKSALQTYENQTVLFIQTDKGFEPKPVQVGKENGISVEILSGLTKGQFYVSRGGFTLNAQLSKGGFGNGHNH